MLPAASLDLEMASFSAIVQDLPATAITNLEMAENVGFEEGSLMAL